MRASVRTKLRVVPSFWQTCELQHFMAVMPQSSESAE